MIATLVQMRVDRGRRSGNLSRALAWIEQASDLDPGPDLIVLPECVDWGLPLNSDSDSRIEPHPGTFAESLAERARGLGVFMAVGVSERHEGRIHSSALLIDPDGDFVARQRRITVSPGESEWLASGTCLEVRASPLGKIGLMVGRDLQCPPLLESMLLMRPDLVVVTGGTWETGKQTAKQRDAGARDFAVVCKKSRTAMLRADTAWNASETESAPASAGSWGIGWNGKIIGCDLTGKEMLISVELAN